MDMDEVAGFDDLRSMRVLATKAFQVQSLDRRSPKWELASHLRNGKHQDLVGFWGTLVRKGKAVPKSAQKVGNVILSLACGDIRGACKALLQSKNFRLSSIVANIGSFSTEEIRTQLNDWRESNVLSEVSDEIRAVYEILGGNACVCSALKSAPIENRVRAFTISREFGLDWKQALGLRVFCTSRASFMDAARSYLDDVSRGDEPAPPRSDALWVLLKMFAEKEFDWDAVDSIGWLLTMSLVSLNKPKAQLGYLNFGQAADMFWARACESFALRLTSHGHWLLATLVLSNQRQTLARDQALRAHISQNAPRLGWADEPQSPFMRLLQGTFSPAHQDFTTELVWHARALYSRYNKNFEREYRTLLGARDFNEANRTVLKNLGPHLILGRSFSKLGDVLNELHASRHHFQDFQQTTAVYLWFYFVRQMATSQYYELDHSVFYDGLQNLCRLGRGDPVQTAAVMSMAEDLMKLHGITDHRLYGLLTGDVREHHLRELAMR
jgi:nuclear pore complex protein Nup98-Nup96